MKLPPNLHFRIRLLLTITFSSGFAGVQCQKFQYWAHFVSSSIFTEFKKLELQITTTRISIQISFSLRTFSHYPSLNWTLSNLFIEIIHLFFCLQNYSNHSFILTNIKGFRAFWSSIQIRLLCQHHVSVSKGDHHLLVKYHLEISK